MNKQYDKWLYFVIVLLLGYLIIRLIFFSQIISYFPLTNFMDGTSHMALVHFLSEYGFHNTAGNWYQGFSVLQFYSPAWFFFTSLFYNFANLRIAVFISIILIYLISLIFMLILGKLANLSKVESLGLYSLFFVNPVTISYLLNLGRIPELFSWMIFILFFCFVVYYKNRNLGRYSVVFILVTSLLLLSHQSVFILASFFLLSLFLIKPAKERVKLIVFFIISLLIASFWLVPYVTGIFNATYDFGPGLEELISFKPSLIIQNTYSTGIPLLMLLTFFFYWKTRKFSGKELLFFLPLLILGFLFMTRILCFVPILRLMWVDSYNILFFFLASYFFLKTDKEEYAKFKNFVLIVLQFVPIIFLIFFVFYLGIPSFVYTSQEKEAISIISEINSSQIFFIMDNSSNGDLPEKWNLFSYSAIYYNLTTPQGWFPQTVSKGYSQELDKTEEAFTKFDCSEIKNRLKNFKVDVVLTYNNYCSLDEKCNFTKIKQGGYACLLEIQ